MLVTPLAETEHASVVLRGAWTAPGGSELHALDAHVGLAGGALADLYAGDAPAARDGAPIAVDVRFSAPRALDGVDLARLSPSEIAYAFLRGLAHATVAVARR